MLDKTQKYFETFTINMIKTQAEKLLKETFKGFNKTFKEFSNEKQNEFTGKFNKGD